MSRKLTNEFTWSVSRSQQFAACLRAYYYSYYGSWGGWDADAPDAARRLYLLKNVKPMVLWAGSIVHEIIKDTLDEFARSGFMPTAVELKEQARAKLRSGWIESVTRAWEKRPKRTNLFELFYGNGRTLPREDTDRIRTRIYDDLESFRSCPTVATILGTPYLQWKPVDVLDSFQVNEFKVWCAIDFAFVDDRQVLHIIDWKTGHENRATLRQQLGCYALYALEKWHVPPERTALHGVFLNDGGRRSDYPLDPELLITVKDQILTSIQAMRSRLRDPEANAAEEEDFPMTGDDFTCGRCQFRKACPRWRDQFR